MAELLVGPEKCVKRTFITYYNTRYLLRFINILQKRTLSITSGPSKTKTITGRQEFVALRKCYRLRREQQSSPVNNEFNRVAVYGYVSFTHFYEIRCAVILWEYAQ